jgi:hypothetical protein
MLKDAAERADRTKGCREAPLIVTRSVVLTTIALEVERCEVHPQLARRMGDDWIRSRI